MKHSCLTFIHPVGQSTHRQIRLHWQQFTAQDRSLMARIAIVETTRFEIEHSHKHRREEATRLTLRKGLIDTCHDSCRIADLIRTLETLQGDSRFIREQGLHHRHQQRRRHSLAAHITNAEDKAVVVHQEVIEIATHLTGWSQRGKYLHWVLLLVGERMRQHGILNACGNLQFVRNTLLVSVGCL